MIKTHHDLKQPSEITNKLTFADSLSGTMEKAKLDKIVQIKLITPIKLSCVIRDHFLSAVTLTTVRFYRVPH